MHRVVVGLWVVAVIAAQAVAGVAPEAGASGASAGMPPAGTPAGEIARLVSTPVVRVDGAVLDAERLRTLYAARSWQPLWTADAAANARNAAVAATLAAAAEDGLEPADYHAAEIAARLAHPAADGGAGLEVLMSDGVMRYAGDLRGGVAPPRGRTDEIALAPLPVDPIPLALAAAAAADVQVYLVTLRPRHPAYDGLRQALAQYRTLAASGGWPVVPDGPSIHPGESDAVIPIVRRRLAVTGELAPGDVSDATVYDPGLQAAVASFQNGHGLTADGVIGRSTRAALGASVTERIQQIAVNMERWRWLPDDLGHRYVRVNIPAFWLDLVDDGRVVAGMPVVVGSPARPTPVFSSHITHMVFNPSWTVPVKLAKEDMLPKVRRDPEYFAQHGIQVYGGWHHDAEAVDTTQIDWDEMRSQIGGMKLRQAPGPGNPLGRIKFELPNGYDVYLHDTNSKGLMKQARRALSSGCVRLGDAFALADWLLTNQADWTPERRAELTADWETHTVRLRHSIPVYVLYLTAWRDEAGVVRFREDIYGRDRGTAKAMAAARRGRTGSET